MALDTALAATGTQLGYARVSTGHQSLDQQVDALTAAGVDATRVYSDKLSGTSAREQRPGLASLLDYARQGDAIVVVGIDRLGRNAAEVMTTIRELGERGIVLRSLREGMTRPMRQVAWWPVCSLVWPSLSWSWAGSVAPHREKHGEHVASPSVDPERWISQRPLWRSACTPAVNRLPPLRRRLASAAPRSIACSAVATTEHFVMVQWRC